MILGFWVWLLSKIVRRKVERKIKESPRLSEKLQRHRIEFPIQSTGAQITLPQRTSTNVFDRDRQERDLVERTMAAKKNQVQNQLKPPAPPIEKPIDPAKEADERRRREAEEERQRKRRREKEEEEERRNRNSSQNSFDSGGSSFGSFSSDGGGFDSGGSYSGGGGDFSGGGADGDY